MKQPRVISTRHAQGFTLIEMMVALTLALIVTAAVLAFIFSIIRANSETVLSTRLNQELRATMAVVAGELRRSRSMRDPIAAVAQSGAVANPYATVNIATAGCIQYAYAADVANTEFRSIRLENGALVLARAAAGPGCAAAGTSLNSDGIEITGLTFSNPGGSSRRVDVELTGRLRNPPAYMGANPSMAVQAKTIRQTVSIRSNEA